MKDEIKEILDYFRKYSTIRENTMITKIEDYITNLQEENERLKEYRESYRKELDFWRIQFSNLEDRIDKAIEYIKEKDLTNNANFMDDGVGYLFEDIINLLQGKSDE